jgi:ATP-dependent DNA helicase RecQ
VDKISALKEWTDGSVKWMIAMTAFGMGLDYPSVCYVFHAGQSYSLEDYHQETGRLSRDGRKGISICVTSADFVRKYMQSCTDLKARQQLTR